MLPDLPSLKRDIQKALDRYLMRQVHARLGIFNELPKHAMHEGNRMLIIRADGSRDETELKRASTDLSVNRDDIPHLTLEKRHTILNEIADRMARQMSKQLFGTLTEVIDSAGQVVDQKGKPLDAESVFAMLEKIELEFDETGQHQELQIVVPPALAPKATKVFEQIHSDAILRKRYEEIIVRKKIDWRDREASRKLVG